jgi:hypothetical protein
MSATLPFRPLPSGAPHAGAVDQQLGWHFARSRNAFDRHRHF